MKSFDRIPMSGSIGNEEAVIICALFRDEYLTLSGSGYVAELEEYENS